AEGLVKRGLTRIITPGTLLDESALEDGMANYLVAVTGLESDIGIAALDCSTGEFLVEHAANRQDLALAFARLQAAEIIISDTLDRNEFAREQIAELHFGECPTITAMPDYAWRAQDARRTLGDRLGVTSLEGFGIGTDEDHLVSAAAAALRYAAEHAFDDLNHINRIRRIYANDHLIMDAVCQRNLDLLRNSRDNSRNGTLLQCIDRCRSAAGSRMLASWIARPLAQVDAIDARHQGVAAFLEQQVLCLELREELQSVYDLERLLTRVATGRCHARDLVQLASTLDASRSCQLLISNHQQQQWPQVIRDIIPQLNPAEELSHLIHDCLVDEPPLNITEGGMIRDGYDNQLDELRVLKNDASSWLAAYQARECERCNIPKMKVGYNKIIGYFIEISKIHTEKVPDDFIRKQTLVNAERYITPELKEYEEKALGAEDSIRNRESHLFSIVRSEAENMLAAMQQCAQALACIDVLCCFADNAQRLQWCRPQIDQSLQLNLGGARHPVVERVIGRENFVANDCQLNAGENTNNQYLALITGPNMAGKSTYIRQVALAVDLAQAATEVPA
ncbi:MAG: DNA mismatch repair protein MutS, partial [Planctomycetes bacterium]|nr:DNA mismatch repair protein MutS [Planctomycetota bacterium]